MYSKFVAGAVIVGTFLFAGVSASGQPIATPGEKLDSGLGVLPHYGEWKANPELSHLTVRDAGVTEPLAAATR
jgi:hypothetical protein